MEVGDEVFTADPETGETGPRTVTHVWPHDDWLLELEDGSEIRTTEDHHYWSHTDREWQESQELDEGDLLLTSDGGTIAVDGLDWTTVESAPAYDLTVQGLHTFFVVSDSGEGVLVHNVGPCIRNQHLAGGNHPVADVPFDEAGFPNFSAWRLPDVDDVRITLSGNRATDARRANEAAGLSSTPEGYVWHHHQDSGLMHLFDEDIHRATGHTGGFSLGG